MEVIEATAAWLVQLLLMIVAFIPKLGQVDDERSIALMPFLVRLLVRIRRVESREWLSERCMSWDAAVLGSSAGLAAIRGLSRTSRH